MVKAKQARTRASIQCTCCKTWSYCVMKHMMMESCGWEKNADSFDASDKIIEKMTMSARSMLLDADGLHIVFLVCRGHLECQIGSAENGSYLEVANPFWWTTLLLQAVSGRNPCFFPDLWEVQTLILQIVDRINDLFRFLSCLKGVIWFLHPGIPFCRICTLQ